MKRVVATSVFLILSIALAACTAPQVRLSPAAAPTGVPQVNVSKSTANAANHVPVIVRVAEREETKGKTLYLYKDIYFLDAAGDATVVLNKLVSLDPEGGLFLQVSDDPITASAAEQQREGLATATIGCPTTLLDPFSFTIEDRVQDRAGNLSRPITFTVSCVANPPSNSPFLIAGGIVGLLLLLGTWLFFRLHPAESGSTTRSILLLFLSLLPITLLLLLLHEGGHALSDPSQMGRESALFVHPFVFSGYSRPMFEYSSIWQHAAGSVTAILASLLISLPFWKQRSIPNFFLVSLFPLATTGNGVYILTVNGDFRNIMNITGLPPLVFNLIGGVIAAVGILCFLSLLPLLGLSPQDKKVLLVLPAGYFLWVLLSTIVAYLFVPASPFVIQYHLAGEILQSANAIVWIPIQGLALAALYLTLYRWISTRLPAGMRTATVQLRWSDLRIPGLLAAISVIVGLVIIL